MRNKVAVLLLLILLLSGHNRLEAAQATRVLPKVGELDSGKYDPSGEVPPQVVRAEEPRDMERERAQIKTMMPVPWYSGVAIDLLVKFVDRKDAQKKSNRDWTPWDWIEYLFF